MESPDTYFEPISTEALDFSPDSEKSKRIGDRLRLHTGTEGFPDLQNVQLALIGVPEERNAYDNVGCALAPDEIRRAFYHLYRLPEMPIVADLGNLRLGKDVEDTYLALSELIAWLISENIVPILLGGSHDLLYAQYLAYERMERVVNISCVDTRFDIGEDNVSHSSRDFFHRIILRQPNYLFNYSNLGYQTYFVDPDEVKLMEKLRFDAWRFGILHENIMECEPVLRDSDLLGIDMSAVRFSDAPGCRHTSPNGLDGKEICTICRLAGASSRLSSFGIYEYNPGFDIAEQSAKLIAEMLWYFLDGFTLRCDDLPDIGKENYTQYIVDLQDGLYRIRFYESKVSHQWWMEVPSADKKAKYERYYLIPCSRRDYDTACHGEIPERWNSTYIKLEKK